MTAIINQDTLNLLKVARPIVAAMNSLHTAHDEATSILLDECDEVFDDHDLDPVRDMCNDHLEGLFHSLNEALKPVGITIRFNRLSAEYQIVEISSV